MSEKPSLGARLRYQFDRSMAAGTIALIGWLALLSLVIIAIAGLVLAITGIAPEGAEALSVGEGIWASLMRTLDAGTMGGDTGWAFRVLMLLVTLAGIFIVSALIGVLSAGLETKLDELRKGRSRVLESDHTIIYNWSPSIFDVISELAIANASRKRPRIVIMADRDKVEMEDEIAAKATGLGRTRVICRSGDPTDLFDLSIANPQEARSIIVLSPDGDDPDSQVIKTLLALTNDPDRRAGRYRIAAEIRSARNADLARAVGGDEVQLVLADDLIARIVVQSSRQAGLSAVYTELLDFDGSEIYTVDRPEMAGRSFGELIADFPDSTLIGLADASGAVRLCPPLDEPVKRGEKAIVIAEDDDKIRLVAGGGGRFDEAVIRTPPRPERHAERTLVLGWNRRGPLIARELSLYAAPGSLLAIGADLPDLEAEVSALPLAGDALYVEFGEIDTTSHAMLASLDIPSFDHVLVLGYCDHLAPQPTDTRTLVTLLQIRKVAEAAGRHVTVVSEMVDVRNRRLAEVTRADDFVVSNKLVSMMLAQASENDAISAIFADLLDHEGSNIDMRPISDYVATGRAVTFATLAESARRVGEIAIGFRITAQGPDGLRHSEVAVNPPKARSVTFKDGDKVIVLSRS